MKYIPRMTAILLLAALSYLGACAAELVACGGLEKLWADLGSRDPETAERVMTQLVANPAQTIPFLREHLRPVTAPETRSRVAVVGQPG